LNKEKKFETEVDWNFNKFGKLWAYNLNYFDYLNQQGVETKEALKLIESFCKHPEQHRVGIEPYPLSLRGINWIKFFSTHEITDVRFDRILFSGYHLLAANLEYHLLGNHLLENGFSLLFGAYYFHNDALYEKARVILEAELKEQILNDGAHFELSPMYHQILLWRLLDCINLVQHNGWKKGEMLSFFQLKAAQMLGWLRHITFKNGDVPMVNDSAYGIAPAADSLFKYAHNLNVPEFLSPLSDSGYRMIRTDQIELFLDIGNIGPDYIPGHAHSDTFNFLLYIDSSPIIVDTSTSTYDAGPQRITERSTRSHNTVMVMDRDQSEVWSSFRVGRRAKIKSTEETENRISATHNGYESIGVVHQRTWQWKSNTIEIEDKLIGKTLSKNATAFFHFHPTVDVIQENNVIIGNKFKMTFNGPHVIRLANYAYAAGFNLTQPGKVLIVSFEDYLKTTLTVNTL
jgi:uncharacterized heparinase superfamily protein